MVEVLVGAVELCSWSVSQRPPGSDPRHLETADRQNSNTEPGRARECGEQVCRVQVKPKCVWE